MVVAATTTHQGRAPVAACARPGGGGAGGGRESQPRVGRVERLHADPADDLRQAQQVDRGQGGGRGGGGARRALGGGQRDGQTEEDGAGEQVVDQVEAGEPRHHEHEGDAARGDVHRLAERA